MPIRLQVIIVGDASHKPKGKTPAPIATFLEITPPTLSLDELADRISKRYTRLYPHNRPLNIQRLQDSEGNDLDVSYIVGDVFDDKSSNRETSIVRVVHKDVLRDDSVPPESGLRPGGVKKRPIQTLSTVEELEPVEEESVGVPVTHRSKRQRLDTVEDGEAGESTVNGSEHEQGRQRTATSDSHDDAGPSNEGTRLESPSVGPGFGSVMNNHVTGDSTIPGQPERGGSLIPETSQGLADLLSPKEETFSSPLLAATTYKTASLSIRPVEISSEIEELEAPLIAPNAVKGAGAKKSMITKPGALKRPVKTPPGKKSAGKNSDVYEVEDSEESSEEENTGVPVKRPVVRPSKKAAVSTPKKIVAPRRSTASATPVVSPSQTSNFTVEIPPTDNERRLSGSTIPHVEDLLGSKKKPEEVGTTLAKPSGKPGPPPKAAKKPVPAGRKGSTQPEASGNSKLPAAKPVLSTTARVTPKSTTPESNEANNGKQLRAGSILQSALRDPEKRNSDAKKSVSFANEGSPSPTTRTTAAVTVPPADTKTQKEVRIPRTTVKIPAPAIPPELRGIGSKATAEQKKRLDEFTEKPPRKSLSKSPVRNGAVVSPPIESQTTQSSAKAVRTNKKGANGSDVSAKATTAAPSKMHKTDISFSKLPSSSDGAESSEDEDEVMKDAPPLSKKAMSSSPESSSAESESESSEGLEKDKGNNSKPAEASETDTDSSESSDSGDAEEPKTIDSQTSVAQAVSDSSDEDYEGAGGRQMTREESPVKGPNKRQLRSSSPEKKDLVRISYNTAPSKLLVEPVKKLRPTNDNSSSSEEDSEDDDDEEEEDSEDEKVKAVSDKTTARKSPVKATVQNPGDSSSESDHEEEEDSSESDDGSETSETAVPQSSISVVPESPIVKPKPPTIKKPETEDSDTNTTTSESESESDSESSEEDSEDQEKQKKKTPEPTKVDKSAKAVENLFRRERESSANTGAAAKARLTNGGTVFAGRGSKTPEPSQVSVPAKLPPSRMNRNTLGYISPSPGPPSSMPARLPTMMLPKDQKKRSSLNTHYRGLSSLSQQELPETRDGARRAGSLGAAATITPRPIEMTEKRKMFENMLSSQKAGKDSDSSDDSDDSDESKQSSDEEDDDDGKQDSKTAEKEKPQRQGGLKSLFGLL